MTTALILLAGFGCAGYQFGHRSLYSQNIRYVYVPVFECDSLRRNLGERLTEAVVKQIELRTPYKVVGPTQADSILTGRITSVDRRVTVQDPDDQQREMVSSMRVRIAWVTPQGQPLATPIVLPVPEAYLEAGQSDTLVPEVGQSVATNQQEIIDRLAAQIVSMMEMPW